VQVRSCTDGLLAEAPFMPSFIDVEGDPVAFESYDFVLPADPTACSIELRHGEDVIDSRVVSPNAPVVDLLSPNGGEVWEGDVTVSWVASDTDGDTPTFLLQYSGDGGLTWLPIASRLAGTEYTFDSSSLPGSDDARVRILATDGANTSEDMSDAAFSVVDKPPRVQIVAPAEGGVLYVDELQSLSGAVYDTFGNRLDDDGLFWAVDGQTVGMGAGADVFLDVGPHEITLIYFEGSTAVAADIVNVTVEDNSLLPDPDEDFDDDGIGDQVDNCIENANADQRDTNGDGFGNVCDPDLNNDGLVTVTDFLILRGVLNSADENADLNNDGLVTVTDFLILRGFLNQPPGPSGLVP
jgi:hypothetical protein